MNAYHAVFPDRACSSTEVKITTEPNVFHSVHAPHHIYWLQSHVQTPLSQPVIHHHRRHVYNSSSSSSSGAKPSTLPLWARYVNPRICHTWTVWRATATTTTTTAVAAVAVAVAARHSNVEAATLDKIASGERRLRPPPLLVWQQNGAGNMQQNCIIGRRRRHRTAHLRVHESGSGRAAAAVDFYVFVSLCIAVRVYECVLWKNSWKWCNRHLYFSCGCFVENQGEGPHFPCLANLSMRRLYEWWTCRQPGSRQPTYTRASVFNNVTKTSSNGVLITALLMQTTDKGNFS